MSRQAYYKSIRKEITAGLSQELALQMVSSIRRQMPRIGGKKLYHMIKGDLDEMGLAMGRDRFFALLRENRLLVKRKKSYTRTTDSFHRFRVHRNLIRELDIAGVSSPSIITGLTSFSIPDIISYIFTENRSI